MKVTAAVCKECGDAVYSRTRHDFRWCSCGKTFIDGGFDYIRSGGEVKELIELEIEADKKKLYNDWNFSKDKFGLIKNA